MNGGLFGLAAGERGHRSIELPHLDLEGAIAAPSENFIINPSMGICQRSGGVAGTTWATAAYGPDRWKMFNPGAAIQYVRSAAIAADFAYSGAGTANAAMQGTPWNRLRHAQYATLSIGHNAAAMFQPIESHLSTALLGRVVVMQLLMLDASAGAVPVQFGLLESTNTIDAPGAPFAGGAPLSLSAGFAPCQVLKTWNCGSYELGARGVVLGWTFMAAAFRVRYCSAANALINNLIPFIAPISTVGIGGVDLLPGSCPRIWTPRSRAEELAMCERFYQKTYNVDVIPGTVTAVGADEWHAQTTIAASVAGTQRQSHPFRTRMMKNPAVVLYASSTGAANGIANITGGNVRGGCTVSVTGESGFLEVDVDNSDADAITANDTLRAHWTADAEIN